jgi:uncharacterized DUF497 family protein
MRKKTRTYRVTFKYLKTGEERTVTVKSTDSLNASLVVYQNFKKINVISAKPVNNTPQT